MNIYPNDFFILCRGRFRSASAGAFDLSIHSYWGTFTGFSDKRKIISGSLFVEFVWNTSNVDPYLDYLAEPRYSVDITNLVTGESAVTRLDGIYDPQVQLATATNKYVGDFKQTISKRCFPFDRVEMSFRIRLVPPGNRVYELGLFCAEVGAGDDALPEGVRAFGANGEALERSRAPTAYKADLRTERCVQDLGLQSVGFEWESFDCVLNEQRTEVTCSMVGLRTWGEYIETFVAPSTIFFVISFMSSCLDVGMSMPRIAATMIMLLTINNMRNTLIARVPMGETSWLEEYFLLGLLCMFFNVLAHVFAFKFRSEGLPKRQLLVDDIAFYGLSSAFPFIVLLRLRARGCDARAINTSMLNALVVLAGAFFFGSMFILWRRHRLGLAEEFRSLSQELKHNIMEGDMVRKEEEHALDKKQDAVLDDQEKGHNTEQAHDFPSALPREGTNQLHHRKETSIEM